MTPDQRLLLIGGYISSALYLSGCFVAGLIFNKYAAFDALTAVGFSCVAYALQLASAPRVLCFTISAVSWIVGLAAGLRLLLTMGA